MWRNYFLQTCRNFRTNKGYSFLNVLGLALGIACCMIIFIYVHNELNYDKYHEGYKNIYRIEFFRESFIGSYYIPSTPAPIAPIIRERSPQVEKLARLIPPFENRDNVLVVNDEQSFFETEIYFADPEITEIFSFRFLDGSSSSALIDPFTVVISKSMAKKYFGNDDPIGKILNIEIDYDWYCPVARDDFTVTAVIDDTPTHTHCPIHMMLSMETIRSHLPWIDEYWHDMHQKYTYIKLRNGVDPKELDPLLTSLSETAHEKYQEVSGRTWSRYSYFLQPISDIHMDSRTIRKIKPAGNWYYIKIYSLMAFIVLLIGVMNFINISLATGIRNIKQLGIRKILGAKRSHLARHCFVQSLVYTCLAFVLAFAFMECMLPVFNRITALNLSPADILNYPVILSIFGLLSMIVFITGGYNAFILTGYKPTIFLRGSFTPGSRGLITQNLLVIFQFGIIILVLGASFVVYRQLDYMQGSSLGFSKQNKIILPFKSNLHRLRTDPENIKQEFRAHPEISGATISSGIPGNMRGGYYMTRQDLPEAEPKWFNVLTADRDFFNEYELSMITGKSLSELEENEQGYVINEEGARLLGFPHIEDALGTNLHSHYHGIIKPVVGIVSDFHYMGMQEKISPLVMDIENSLYSKLTLSFSSYDLPGTLKFIKKKWKELFPGTPFSYSFLDEDFDRQYKHETQTALMISIISAAGLVIAAIGLFGLVSFFVLRRTKEIGIRKVLGSSVSGIVSLFSFRFIPLVIIASLFAIPLSWFIMKLWLRNFAYKIQLDLSPFILSGLLVMTVAVAVIALKCYNAAGGDPIKALKYE